MLDSFPGSVRLTSIYSQGDRFCPPSSCRLEPGRGAHLKNVEVARGGHLAFLSNARIASIIRRELDSAEPPGAASSHPPVAATVDEGTPSAARAA
jgi:hypothetical protein